MEDKSVKIKLYRFMSDENFHKYLDRHVKGEVYLSSWEGVNDPMEGACIYQTGNENRKSFIEVMNFIDAKKRISICCFTKSYKNFLLWSHYANKHQGVCLEYEVDPYHIKDNCHLAPINYVNSLPPFAPFFSEEDQAARVLLTKMAWWKYEDEVRLLGRDQVREYIPFGALTGVILGMNFGKSENKDLAEFCQRGNPPKLYQAMINSTKATIGIKEIENYYL